MADSRPSGKPGSTTVGRAGPWRGADAADRPAARLGEVAGELLDQAGQHDAGGDRREGEQPGPASWAASWAAISGSAVPSRPAKLSGRYANAASATSARERPADRKKPQLKAVMLRSPRRGRPGRCPPWPRALRSRGLTAGTPGRGRRGDRAEDQGRHQRDGAGREQTGGHAGAVADVVPHVIGATLSVRGAALRGSSSGIPCSAFPTRSAPTSAGFVKMPPPMRMDIAMRAWPGGAPE